MSHFRRKNLSSFSPWAIWISIQSLGRIPGTFSGHSINTRFRGSLIISFQPKRSSSFSSLSLYASKWNSHRKFFKLFNGYFFMIVKVGLESFMFIRRVRAKAFTKVVLPAPSSPDKYIMVAPAGSYFRFTRRTISSLAMFSVSFTPKDLLFVSFLIPKY